MCDAGVNPSSPGHRPAGRPDRRGHAQRRGGAAHRRHAPRPACPPRPTATCPPSARPRASARAPWSRRSCSSRRSAGSASTTSTTSGATWASRRSTGYTLPAASTARQWLDRFHEPELLEGRPAQGSFIPMESAGLAGLRAVLVTAVRVLRRRGAGGRHGDPRRGRPPRGVLQGARRCGPTRASGASSRRSCRGRRPGSCSRTSSGTATCPRAWACGDWWTRRTPRCRRAGAWKVSVRSDSAAYEGDLLDHWAGGGGASRSART